MENLLKLMDDHGFWDNQPVPKTGEQVSEDQYDAPIDVEKTVDDIRAEPHPLPAGYTWANVDIHDDKDANDVYELLTKHYVEDDAAHFRFDYSVPFLRWATATPHSQPDMVFGVRGGKKNTLFGFITAIPLDIVVNGKKSQMVEINFLCVHKKLREKRLAPILIKEVTRRTNRRNVWQAAYTAGVTIPTPYSDTTYFHRCINAKKCIDIQFFHLPQNTPFARYQKRVKLPEKPKIPGIRPMEPKDVPQVAKLLASNLQTFKVHPEFTKEEVEHFFLPRDNVIESWVVPAADEKDGDTITDFISFYSLPSTVLRNPNYTDVRVAYAYYFVANTHSMEALFEDALIIARDKGYDVFNSLNIMGYGE